MKRKLSLLLVVLSLAVAGGFMGCSSSSSGGGGGSTSTSNVDLAVGNLGFAGLSEIDLFFNVLNFSGTAAGLSYPTPSVVLSGVTSGIGEPDSIILTNADLIVCDGQGLFGAGNDTVSVWRGYKTLVNDAVPDITFTNGGPLVISDPAQCVYDATTDTLAVGNAGTNNVLLISAFTSILAGTDPVATVVTLNSASSLINDPTGLAIANGSLYVANQANTGPGAPCVSIFRDITALADGAAPDATLSWDASFFPNTSGILLEFCTEVAVGSNGGNGTVNDTLFVSSVVGEVFVFNNAATLVTDALPNAIIFGDSGQLSAPIKPLLVGSELLVPNLNLSLLIALMGGGPGSAITCDGAPGVVGFSQGPAGFLSGQQPNLTIGPDDGVRSVFGIAMAGNALFVASESECVPFPADSTGVQVFSASSGLNGSPAPSFTIPGSASGNTPLAFPISVSAIQVSQNF